MTRAAALLALMQIADEPCMGRRAHYIRLPMHPQRNPEFIKRDLARAHIAWRAHDHLDVSTAYGARRGNLVQVRRK